MIFRSNMYCNRFLKTYVRDREKILFTVNMCQRYKSGGKNNSLKEEATDRVIKRIPPKITKLIFGQSMLKEWPSPKVVTEITVRCSLAGVTIREIETFLIRESRNKEKSKNKGKEDYFSSRHIYERWLKGKEKLELETIIDYCESMLLKQKGEVDLPMNRVEYIISIWRVICMVEEYIKEDTYESQTFVRKFGERCFEKYGNLDILTYTCLAELQYTQNPTVPDVSRKPLVGLLQAGVPLFVQEHKSDFPKTLLFENVEHTLLNLLKLDMDPILQSSVLMSLSLHRWRRSNFSESLQALSSGTSTLLQCLSQIESEDVDEHLAEVAVQFCSTWMQVCSSAINQAMTPALEYLEVETQNFIKNYPLIGFLPFYVFSIASTDAPKSSGDKSMADFSRIPKNLRNEKFEKTLTVESMTKETKLFFTSDFLKKCLAVKGNVESTKCQEASEYDSSAESHLDLKREIFDVDILERLVDGDSDGILDLYLQNAKSGMYPSDETGSGIAKFFSNKNDIDSLNLLCRGTHEDSRLKGLFYNEISNIEIKVILHKWEAGDRLLAWIRIVELYRNILSDRVESRIERETAEVLIHKCRQISKLFIEESIQQKDSFEDALRSGGLRLASEYRDVYILLAIWEAFFFSPNFESQQKAEKIMEDYPQLVNFIRIDDVLSKAEKFNQENIFRRLLELNLRHESSTYSKSRTFEALLRYQTKSGNIVAGENTIKTAKALDIRITAEYLQDFIQLREESLSSEKNTVLSKAYTSFKDLFKSK